MTAFQVILVAALGAMLLGTLVGGVRGWASRPVLAAWAGLLVVGMAAVIRPEATTRVASMLGIRRGADLLLYCTSVGMLAGFFMMYVRLRRVRSDLTILTRQVALMTVHDGQGGAALAPEEKPNEPGPSASTPPRSMAAGERIGSETFLKTP